MSQLQKKFFAGGFSRSNSFSQSGGTERALDRAVKVAIAQKDPEHLSALLSIFFRGQEGGADIESTSSISSASSFAKRSERTFQGSSETSLSSTESSRPRTFPFLNHNIGFAFDIDGVIHRSGTILPHARETILLLQENNIPTIFLTNGGGKTEQAHAQQISQKLALPLDGRQFVQSHTPWLDIVPEYADKNVLALGGVGNAIRDVAHAYGFKNVITDADLVTAYHDIFPFHEYTFDTHKSHAKSLPAHSEDEPLRIHAILVWSSPRDWGLDAQLIVDLLLSSKGHLGTNSSLNGNTELPNSGYCQDEPPALFWCNPDLTFASSYAQPRHAQGAFQAAVEGMFAARTGGAKIFTSNTIGKPTAATYEYGEKVLREIQESLNPGVGLKTVFMIGDNPASDIAGTNAFYSQHGIEWKSVLVESGVYVAGTVPEHQPTVTVLGIGEAVEWAIDVALKAEEA